MERKTSLSREYCSETEKVEYDQKEVAPNYLQPLPPSLPLALWALIATAREMISISDGVEEGKRERPESYLRLSRKEEEDRGQTNIRERERGTLPYRGEPYHEYAYQGRKRDRHSIV